MTRIATRLLVVLLAYGAAPCASAGAQARPDPNPQEKVTQAAPEPVAIDIARIRRVLAEPQPPGSLGIRRSLASMFKVEFVPQPIRVDANGVLRFEETVHVYGFKMPTFEEQLDELEKKMNFPYSYAPSAQEITAHWSALQYVHPVNAVMAAHKAISGALYRAKVEKARREVEAELRALEAQNARLAGADSKPPKKRN